MTTIPEEAVFAAAKAITGPLRDPTEWELMQFKLAITAALPHLPRVGVKKLEWELVSGDHYAEGAGTHYNIYQTKPDLWNSVTVRPGNVRLATNVDLEAAKAAAQADYEARILSALEPSAARELALEEAAKIAFDISENGEYHGEASVDSTSSIYQQGAFEVYEAIRALSSPGHADAAKVEGDDIERTEFIRGYILACANIVNLHGADVAVMEGFAQLGISKAELKALDLCEYDQRAIDALEDYFGADKLYRTSALSEGAE